jgi:hypothetical protein
MNKLLTILLLITLVGCKTVPVTVAPPFPDAPEALRASCPDLAPVSDDTTKLSDALQVISKNYNQYYECKIKVDNWIEWYLMQKDIQNKIGK